MCFNVVLRQSDCQIRTMTQISDPVLRLSLEGGVEVLHSADEFAVKCTFFPTCINII